MVRNSFTYKYIENDLPDLAEAILEIENFRSTWYHLNNKTGELHAKDKSCPPPAGEHTVNIPTPKHSVPVQNVRL